MYRRNVLLLPAALAGTESSGEEEKESWVLPGSLSPWNCAVDSSLSRIGAWELKG